MALKNVAKTFRSISSLSVSTADTTFTSSASTVAYLDNVAIQFNWSGEISGSFLIQGSVDYNPGLPQTGQFQNGAWNTYTLSATPTTSSGSSYLVNMQGLAVPYMRVQYLHSSGTGVVSAYVFSKSTGL